MLRATRLGQNSAHGPCLGHLPSWSPAGGPPAIAAASAHPFFHLLKARWSTVCQEVPVAAALQIERLSVTWPAGWSGRTSATLPSGNVARTVSASSARGRAAPLCHARSWESLWMILLMMGMRCIAFVSCAAARAGRAEASAGGSGSCERDNRSCALGLGGPVDAAWPSTEARWCVGLIRALSVVSVWHRPMCVCV